MGFENFFYGQLQDYLDKLKMISWNSLDIACKNEWTIFTCFMGPFSEKVEYTIELRFCTIWTTFIIFLMSNTILKFENPSLYFSLWCTGDLSISFAGIMNHEMLFVGGTNKCMSQGVVISSTIPHDDDRNNDWKPFLIIC